MFSFTIILYASLFRYLSVSHMRTVNVLVFASLLASCLGACTWECVILVNLRDVCKSRWDLQVAMMAVSLCEYSFKTIHLWNTQPSSLEWVRHSLESQWWFHCPLRQGWTPFPVLSWQIGSWEFVQSFPPHLQASPSFYLAISDALGVLRVCWFTQTVPESNTRVLAFCLFQDFGKLRLDWKPCWVCINVPSFSFDPFLYCLPWLDGLSLQTMVTPRPSSNSLGDKVRCFTSKQVKYVCEGGTAQQWGWQQLAHAPH